MTEKLNESWERYPEARIRMREGGLELLLKAMGEGSFCNLGIPRIHRLEDGIYIEIPTNVGKQGHIVFLGLDIFIPVAPDAVQGDNHEQGSVQVDETTG